MRVVAQRVQQAAVSVDDEVVGEIGAGLCCFIGVTHDDREQEACWLAARLAKLRIFADTDGKMNRSVVDVAGEVLVVSQFTLYGDGRKGNRPSYFQAAKPEQAEPLIERVAQELRAHGLSVATGRFRAEMLVSLVNDGPVTIVLESP